MKRILTILCTLAIVMAGSATALAAEPAEGGQSASYYPISVEEYTYGDFDELRINKTYQLSLSDDPSLIPTEDFVRNGRRYYLLDMTRKDEVGVDIQTHTETVTQASDTNSLEAILQRLDAEMEVTTEDGYVGVLRLDHTSVQVTTDGYATKTSTLTASRSYQDSRSLILLSHAWTPPREIQLSSPYFPWYLIYSISSLSLERNLIFCFPYPFFGSGWQENQIFSFQPYPFGGLGWGQKCGNRLNYGCRQCRRRVWALSPMKSL